MQPVLTASQMTALDRYAINVLGLDARILMSCAAREVLRCALERWPQTRRILVLAGPGNNGGDGYALAFYAQQQGLDVHVCDARAEISSATAELGGKQVAGTSPANYFRALCQRAFVPIEHIAEPRHVRHIIETYEPDLIVDALFGTGLDRPLDGYYAQLCAEIELVRQQKPVPLVAIDVPSGMSADTGIGAALRADVTVALGYRKLGLLHANAASDTGHVELVPIGLESDELRTSAGIEPTTFVWDEQPRPWLWQERPSHWHKGHYGRVLIVAGHECYPGAPRLCAGAALRMGAGLVRLVVPRPIHLVCCDDPSIMVAPHTAAADGGFAAQPDPELLEYLDWADALVIGPGLGTGAALELAATLIGRRDIPTVVDADALRVIARASITTPSIWPLVLTPHVGELARCLGITTQECLADWFGSVRSLAARTGALVLAKAHQSVLGIPDGALYFPPAGHPALATGGSGDVLAGMLGSLLAQRNAPARESGGLPSGMPAAALHPSVVDATLSGVAIHGRAGRFMAQSIGENSATATDLLEALPHVLREL